MVDEHKRNLSPRLSVGTAQAERGVWPQNAATAKT